MEWCEKMWKWFRDGTSCLKAFVYSVRDLTSLLLGNVIIIKGIRDITAMRIQNMTKMWIKGGKLVFRKNMYRSPLSFWKLMCCYVHGCASLIVWFSAKSTSKQSLSHPFSKWQNLESCSQRNLSTDIQVKRCMQAHRKITDLGRE